MRITNGPDQRPVLLQMTPRCSQSSFLARSLKEFLEFHHVLSGPNVAKSHGQEFFSRISIALNRCLINHQETPGLIVMNPGSQDSELGTRIGLPFSSSPFAQVC